MNTLILLLGFLNPAHAGDVCEIPVVVNLTGMPDGVWHEFSTELFDAAKMWNHLPTSAALSVSWEPVDTTAVPGKVVVKFASTPGGNSKYLGNTSNKQTRDGHILQSTVEISSTDPWCTTDGQRDCYQIRNTLLHELGHAMGLEHNKNPDSIMYYGTAINTPRFESIPQADIDALMRLFPETGGGCGVRELRYAWSQLP